MAGFRNKGGAFAVLMNETRPRAARETLQYTQPRRSVNAAFAGVAGWGEENDEESER